MWDIAELSVYLGLTRGDLKPSGVVIFERSGKRYKLCPAGECPDADREPLTGLYEETCSGWSWLCTDKLGGMCIVISGL